MGVMLSLLRKAPASRAFDTDEGDNSRSVGYYNVGSNIYPPPQPPNVPVVC